MRGRPTGDSTPSLTMPHSPKCGKQREADISSIYTQFIIPSLKSHSQSLRKRSVSSVTSQTTLLSWGKSKPVVSQRLTSNYPSSDAESHELTGDSVYTSSHPESYGLTGDFPSCVGVTKAHCTMPSPPMLSHAAQLDTCHLLLLCHTALRVVSLHVDLQEPVGVYPSAHSISNSPIAESSELMVFCEAIGDSPPPYNMPKGGEPVEATGESSSIHSVSKAQSLPPHLGVLQNHLPLPPCHRSLVESLCSHHSGFLWIHAFPPPNFTN